MPRSLTASILLAFACFNIRVIRFFFLCCPVRRNLPWRKIRLITELQICIGYHVAFRVQDDRMYLLFQFTHVTQPYVNEQGITGGSVKTSDKSLGHINSLLIFALDVQIYTPVHERGNVHKTNKRIEKQ